jgi:hypothetical protein
MASVCRVSSVAALGAAAFLLTGCGPPAQWQNASVKGPLPHGRVDLVDRHRLGICESFRRQIMPLTSRGDNDSTDGAWTSYGHFTVRRPIPEQVTCEFSVYNREALGGLEVAERYDPHHPMYIALVTVRRDGDWRLNITDHSFEVDD